MQTITNNNPETLKKQFNNYILDCFNSLQNRDRIVIWLSGWSSLNIYYAEFANIFENIDSSLRDKIYFCFLDERVVDFDSIDSNYKLVKELFLAELISKWYVKQTQILLPNFNLNDYETDYFNQVKHIDIWLFWVWPDCHTCSLFPNHALLRDTTFWYLKISDSPKPPSDRITISVNMLYDIDFASAFFMWEGKIEAYNKFMDESVSSDDCPIKLVKNCENLIIFSDLT